MLNDLRHGWLIVAIATISVLPTAVADDSNAFLGGTRQVTGAEAIPGANRPQAAFVSPRGTRLLMMLDESRLGGQEVEVGEITFPAVSDSGEHVHGVVEIFYVLSGELEHIVNGKSELLGAGQIGFVRPPDKVRHKVGPAGPARALVIWAPGGEAARITASWRKVP